MIHIENKSDCCGCEACIQICPQSCITLENDSEGFLYPHVNTGLCISCGRCDEVCPVKNQGKKKEPLAAYAAKNNNVDEQLKSSSGGLYILLAQKTIEEGGVVFGVVFNKDWTVVHQCTEVMAGLYPMMGSKYVQSHIGDSYKTVERLLGQSRTVLFSGTPCQISALRRFLRKDYDNLVTVDVVCHGVPSPGVWRKYLKEVKNKSRRTKIQFRLPFISHFSERDVLAGCDEMNIEGISFREKSKGWKKYSFVLTLAMASTYGQKKSVSFSHIHQKDPFMNLFLKNIILRPSCYRCPAKCGKSGADITLSDFWHIGKVLPDYYDEKGVSLVYLNTEKGIRWFNKVECDQKTVNIVDAIRKRSWREEHIVIPRKREDFFFDFNAGFDIMNLYRKYAIKPFILRLCGRLRRMIRKML